MPGFNMELDIIETEIAGLEAALKSVREEAELDGIIDDEEQADIDEIEALISDARDRHRALQPLEAPQVSTEPLTPEELAAEEQAHIQRQMEEEQAANEAYAAQEAAYDQAMAEKKAAADQAAQDEEETHVIDSSLSRSLTREEVEAFSSDALDKLVSDLVVYQKNYDPLTLEWEAIQNNLDIASDVLGANTMSLPDPEPEKPAIDETKLDADVKKIMKLVQEWHVDDGDERAIMRIIDRYAETPEGLEAFLKKLDNQHYWGGIFGEKFTPGITAVKRELEGGRGKRFIELLEQSKSERFQNYEDPEEVTFSGTLWQSTVEGETRDQIFGYFKGMGDAGVAMAEGVLTMVTKPDEVVKGLLDLPESLQKAWKARKAIWQKMKKEYNDASPEDKGRIIGRITGEIELLIASVPAAGAAGKGAQSLAGSLPKLGLQVPAPALATAAGAVGGATTATIDLAKLGPAAGLAAQGGVLATETYNMSKNIDELASGVDDTVGGVSHADDAPTCELPEGFADDAVSAIDNDGLRAGGEMLGDLTNHAQSPTARKQAGITAAEGNSAHISAQSAMRDLPDYNPRAALTRLLESKTHKAFDDYWKKVFRGMAKTGEKTIPVKKYFEVMSDAAKNNPLFTPEEAASMIELLRDELYVQHGLRDADHLRLPYSKK